MSDFVPRDILPDLWEEILSRHWTFLETEESIRKIEERKKLEGCLKEFLCVVPQDRKFFLPETAHVLRKSIREMDDFSAYKAIMGFESISQFANNLFQKPWCREFRVLKIYSGFFLSEVSGNLLDADKLFEAMGYRRLSDEILVLDGPICPDQVTNVSRDAMAAYVECQIIKHIYAGLVSLGLSCTWEDVFHYREKHMGGTTQAIKGLAYAIQERRLRKEKQISTENCYATIKHVPQQQATPSQCSNCAPYHMTQAQAAYMQQQQLSNGGQCAMHSGCAMHRTHQQQQQTAATNLMYNGGMSAANAKLLASYPAANYQQQQHAFMAPGGHHHQQQPHMSHSRSLEHYNEPPTLLPPHRHSFDHQQQGCTAAAHHHYQQLPPPPQHLYESPYDCLDGMSMSSSVSYAAVAGGPNHNSGGNCNMNAYNVSGNRYPLPYNISSQLNAHSHYATPNANLMATVSCNGVKGTPSTANATSDAYVNVDNANVENAYDAVAQTHNCGNYQQQQQLQQQPPLPPMRHAYNIATSAAAAAAIPPASSSASSKDFQTHRQRSFPPPTAAVSAADHLIDFDDRAPLTSHDFHAQLHNSAALLAQNASSNSFDSYERFMRRGSNRANMNAMYAQPKDVLLCQYGATAAAAATDSDRYGGGGGGGGGYEYARPTPRANKGKSGGSSAGGPSNMTDKYLRNPELMQDYVDNNRQMQMELKERAVPSYNGSQRKKSATHAHDRDSTDQSYDSSLVAAGAESSSFDDFVTVCQSEKPQRSPTQASKNQDGVGSFEQWDYVFQNLERSGYSKDLGERGDLLVQSLDLDSLHPVNGGGQSGDGGGGGGGGVGGAEKRRSANSEAKATSAGRQQTLTMNGGEKSRTLEKLSASEKGKNLLSAPRQEKSILKQQISNGSSNGGGGGGVKKTKSALKSAVTTPIVVVSDNNNGNGNTPTNTRGAELYTKRQSVNAATSTTTTTRHSGAKQRPPVSTQVIVSSPNEWSCRFCTFLNPDTKRICEMCCRSKDFNLEATVSNTPTCV